MTAAASTSVVSVALLGNPNTGKSTLFNALSGTRQRVGNYPGCTVEKKVGRMTHHGQAFDLIDLPGTYSLTPRSPDEMVAVDVLLGRRKDVARPDVLLCIVDAGNLERNLYLVSQALELGLPTVLALNMVDVAKDKGLTIDVPRLQRQLGVPVVELQAHRKQGVDRLIAVLAETAKKHADGHTLPDRESPFPPAFVDEVRKLETSWRELAAKDSSGPATNGTSNGSGLPRYLAERLLLDTSGYLAGAVDPRHEKTLQEQLNEARGRLAEAGCPSPAVEAMARYGWVAKTLEGVVVRPKVRPVSTSDKLDRVLTHRWLGPVVLLMMMVLMFYAVFSWAELEWFNMVGMIEGVQGWVAGLIKANLAEGPLQSLLVDGVVAGVGGVLVFLPQIMILFFFIGVLEDCGYMARAAYLMDRLMSGVGLSGKSFIPMLSSFACAIPGVMATRVIENRRDRLATILVAPLMSCSARLPVYGLLTKAFVPNLYPGGWMPIHALVLVGMYLLGIVTAMAAAWVFKKTLLRGETPPFVMELPSYKWPSITNVVMRMVERGWSFVRRAGTLILAISMLVWAASYYPRNPDSLPPTLIAQQSALATRLAETPAATEAQQAAWQEELKLVDNEIKAEYLRNSYLGRAGQAVEPVFRPLGWDWRIGAAAIASFPAREVVVSVLGVIYNLGEVDIDAEVGEQNSPLQRRLRETRWDPGTPKEGQRVYSLPVALSIMVFFALCAQCAATLAVIARETNSYFWPLFTFSYMTGLAYLGAWAAYNIGMALGW